MLRTLAAVTVMIGTAILSQTAQGQTLDEVAIFIKCTSGAGVTTKGTGVFVSPNGHILTASHVVPQEAGSDEKCEGIVGSTNGPVTTLKVSDRKHTSFDAALLKFTPPPGEEVPFLRFCDDISTMRGAEILAGGFPGDTTSGNLSIRKGIISTVTEDENALIETDVLVAPGMSGGMVTLANRNVLVGLAIGAAFVDPGLGEVDPKLQRVRIASAYNIIPVRRLAAEFEAFGLQAVAGGCGDKPKLTNLIGEDWRAGKDADLDLGLTRDEGVCFITEIRGEFNHVGDRVWIAARSDGMQVLRGTEDGGGTHGASAQCLRH
jgi:hypothetical protein